MEKFTTPSTISKTNMTLAGSSMERRGIAVMIYSVLKTFQSCDITPLRTKFSAKVSAKPPIKAPLAASAASCRVSRSP